MRDTDLLQLALGIMPPWLVEAATFDAEILSPSFLRRAPPQHAHAAGPGTITRSRGRCAGKG